jgi:LysR family transcriptional regulator, flagellar master operon regulator
VNIVLATTFLELVNTRNFNKAADRLCVTQSTVTVRIAALEEQLGQQLFTREKTGVELTVSGRKFQPYAELLLQTWQHAKQELALSSAQSTMLTLGICWETWEGLGRDWLFDLQRNQKNIALNVDSGTSAAMLERLAQGFLDAALLYQPSSRKDIVIEELFDEHLVLVSTYPRKAERWNADYVYVRWGEDFNVQHRAIMPNEITPPVSFNDGKLGLDFILDRGGSAYFPVRTVVSLIEQGRLHLVKNARPMMRRVYFAYTQAISKSDWFEDVVESLRNCVDAQGKRSSAVLEQIAPDAALTGSE